MKEASSLEAWAETTAPLVLAIGFFDGVHLGHRAVLEAALVRARARGGEAWVLTFEPHPLQVLAPDRAPLLITPPPLKTRALRALGPDGCLLLPFTAALADWTPEEFLARLRAAAPTLVEIVVGENWTFGQGARGGVRLLKDWGEHAGVAVSVVPPVWIDGEPVSSTRIRRAIDAGHMREAARLLGRPFVLAGRVEHGRAIGRTLGYPTANLTMHRELCPPPGVYAVRAAFESREGLAAAAYIGRRPTFDAVADPVLEVHLLEGHPDLYGRELEVSFLETIRDDRRFESPEALREQIAADLTRIRAALAADAG